MYDGPSGPSPVGLPTTTSTRSKAPAWNARPVWLRHTPSASQEAGASMAVCSQAEPGNKGNGRRTPLRLPSTMALPGRRPLDSRRRPQLVPRLRLGTQGRCGSATRRRRARRREPPWQCVPRRSPGTRAMDVVHPSAFRVRWPFRAVVRWTPDDDLERTSYNGPSQ
ncbi:hypothetical protein Enr13x_49770 [Stieleria neptunia]|uniref:Uncharacterized protein n=1 Tax=Stieleria neptunia TaxID=2527979 RepID=A0A518HWA4_9BACT|nr:hypothetical protein Enr13x_49770 [Stieleria neptunia]